MTDNARRCIYRLAFRNREVHASWWWNAILRWYVLYPKSPSLYACISMSDCFNRSPLWLAHVSIYRLDTHYWRYNIYILKVDKVFSLLLFSGIILYRMKNVIAKYFYKKKCVRNDIWEYYLNVTSITFKLIMENLWLTIISMLRL